MKKIFLLIGTLLFVTSTAFGYSMPRWGMTSVDVYVPENQYTGTVQRAFNTWAGATGGKMRFRFRTTGFAENNAPIRVTFKNEQAPYYIVTSKRFETTGYFTNMDEGFINRGLLTVYTIDRKGEAINTDDLYGSLLSEIGYILGLEKAYGGCNVGEHKTVMCQDNVGKDNVITDKDRDTIQKKYSRSSEDIKNEKSGN